MIRKVISEKDETGKAGWFYNKKSGEWFTWEVDVTTKGKRIRQRGFATEKKAKDFADELNLKKKLKTFGIAQPEKFPTVEELLARHLVTITSPNLIIMAKRVFVDFGKIVDLSIRLDELKKAHFRAYADKRFADPRKDKREGSIKASTVVREMKFISAAINSAGDYFPQCENWNPPKMYVPSIPKEQTARIVEDEEWQTLIAHLLQARYEKEELRDYIARRRVGLTFYFALLTGLRHGEICAVEKINFDRRRRRLRAKRFKTEKSGIQWTTFEPLTDSHIWVLDEAVKLHPKSVYFFSTRGKVHNKNYQILKNECAKLGINYGRYQEGGFVVHSARHTFATVLDQSGVDRTTSRDFTAHTQDAMFSRYTHVTAESKSNAMEKIENKFRMTENAAITLKEIYQKVRSGKLAFEEFEYLVTRT